MLSGAAPGELAKIALPKEYPASYLRVEDIEMFAGMDRTRTCANRCASAWCRCRSWRRTRCVVAVMASSINYNTVWSAMFEPIPTFGFLERFGRTGGCAAPARPAVPRRSVPTPSGVVVRIGDGVRRWRSATTSSSARSYVDDQEPAPHDDGMMGAEQRAWGFETNFGGLAALHGRAGQPAGAQAART